MKILTPRSAHLTNHEVLHHLTHLRERYTQQHLAHGPSYAMKSGNLETVMHEVSEYLASLPSSLPANAPNTTSPAAPGALTTALTDPTEKLTGFLADLAEASRAHGSTNGEMFGLEKVEILMLVNNRPESQAELYLMVEDVETRLSEEVQEVVLGVVKKWWGGSWGEEGGEEGEEGEEGAEEGGEVV
ncbi:hypothetical protein DFH27DRAFT_654728 [Peziza echinospora]|nr:hypothetical protein DFH27DRAFT_654728 [Peziza echinospora]